MKQDNYIIIKNIKKFIIDLDSIINLFPNKERKLLEYKVLSRISILDFYIIHNLRCKHYVRYMDDIMILCNDKEKLVKVKDIIINKLEVEYKLKVNYKKTFIVSLRVGVEYLGKLFRIINNKTIITIRKSSIKIMEKNIRSVIRKYKNDRISFKYFCNVLMHYMYSYKNNTMILRRYIKKFC